MQMYYQVLIEARENMGKSKATKEITELDIVHKNQIIEDVLVPYLKNEQFSVNGYILNKSDIVRLKVMVTEQSASELSRYENNNMPIGVIMYVSPQDILGYDRYITDITKKLLDEAKKAIISEDTKVRDNEIKKDKTKVFIVHGHDELAVEQASSFVKTLGLEPIILHEQASSGKTIIEKIEEYSNVGFGIVLYTPCDIGASKEESNNLQNRARQNVVFEHGYLIGKLGRNRVCALVKDNIEKPNDISGVVYITMDNIKSWRFEIIREMKKLGYEVDANKLL